FVVHGALTNEAEPPMTLFSRSFVAFILLIAAADLRAETHRFTPTVFYSSFSAALPAALRIKSGDRVVTTTVDNAGSAGDGRHAADGPNPQTGPFFVEGAEPGDLIVVRIEKLDP